MWFLSDIFCCSDLEDVKPDDAIQLYIDACEILEEDGKDHMAFHLYRACANVYIKYDDYAMWFHFYTTFSLLD